MTDETRQRASPASADGTRAPIAGAVGPPPLHARQRSATVAAVAVLVAALALPWLLQRLGLDYYLSLASRILVYAIAATSLNLVLGYGGMVSFGHAAFVGLGAYATGIMISEGVASGGAHLLMTLAVSALAALLIGAISLRTRGVYFIMITLAFAQMVFYLANSVKGYGGDEGLNIKSRSVFALGFAVVDLKNPRAFYYVALAVLGAALIALARFVPSRFGRAILALRDDDVRAEALGFPTYRYKLVVFVVAGALGGVAGALSVNLQGYVSPNVLHWTQSGTLMVMVILGGVGTVWGGAVGAAALLLLQEVLGAHTQHWEFWTGWVLLAVVLFARHGIVGSITASRRRPAGG
jgi:branched-chain amino acid transport system permease protein